MHLSGPQFLPSQSREDKATQSWNYTEGGARLGWGSLVECLPLVQEALILIPGHIKLSAVVHSGNPKTKEVEAGGSEA